MRALVAMLLAVIMVVVGRGSSATEDLLALTNADRSRNGLTALTIVPDLQAYAQGWAEVMMKSGQLSHSAELGAVMKDRVVGENVGQGPTLTDIESAFMASPAHRANILQPDFSEAGVGVVWDGVEHFYVAVVFRQATKTAVSRPAPPEPEPPAAAPSAEPKPGPGAPRPAPATPATSSPPATGRPVRAPALPVPLPAEVPLPRPSPEPDRVESSAPVAREAGPRLSWVLAATTAKSMPAVDAHDGVRTASLIASRSGSAATDRSSPAIPLAVAILWMVYAWTRILVGAHQWLVAFGRSTRN